MRYLLTLLAALTLATPAFAGTIAIYSSPKDKDRHLQIEVADNGDIRVGDPAKTSEYGLLLGETFYMVSQEEGGWKVARMADLGVAFDKVMPSAFKTLFSAAKPTSLFTIEKLGQRQVNGRTGTVYRLKDSSDDVQEVVVSNDPALRPIGRGFTAFIEAATVMMTPMIGPMAEQMRNELRQIFQLGTPIDGGMFTLESVKTAKVDLQRMALPAKPQTVGELVAELEKSASEPEPSGD